MRTTRGRWAWAVGAAALAVLLPAGQARAQCSRGGGRPGGPQSGAIALLRQQTALQQNALLSALQRQRTQQQMAYLVAALEKRQLALQTALDKTKKALTGLETTDGSLPLAVQKKRTALRKKQRQLETALQKTNALLDNLLVASGGRPRSQGTSPSLSTSPGQSRQ